MEGPSFQKRHLKRSSKPEKKHSSGACKLAPRESPQFEFALFSKKKNLTFFFLFQKFKDCCEYQRVLGHMCGSWHLARQVVRRCRSGWLQAQRRSCVVRPEGGHVGHEVKMTLYILSLYAVFENIIEKELESPAQSSKSKRSPRTRLLQFQRVLLLLPLLRRLRLPPIFMFLRKQVMQKLRMLPRSFRLRCSRTHPLQ